MKFDTSIKEEKEKAEEYFNSLISKKYVIDVSRKFNRRTLAQNSYLHLLLNYCSLIMGEESSFFKEFIWKREIAPIVFKTIYRNPVTGEERDSYRSSSDLSTKEITIAIEKLVKWSAENLKIELPDANDFSKLRKIENEIERNKIWI